MIRNTKENSIAFPNPSVPVAISSGCKTLLQPNPPVLNLGCWLTRVDLYNDGHNSCVLLHKLMMSLFWFLPVCRSTGLSFPSVVRMGLCFLQAERCTRQPNQALVLHVHSYSTFRFTGMCCVRFSFFSITN